MSENIKKYPRTFHLTFSEGRTSDDKTLDTDNYFLNKEIIITSKLDGSNFCMTNTSCFARSHSGPPTHKSFDLAKATHNNIKYLIPDNFAIYSEYLFAKHSIYYDNLPSYLAVFNIFDLNSNKWISWDAIEIQSKLLGIPTVPVLFRGIINTSSEMKNLCCSLMRDKEFLTNEREGLVIRISSAFDDKDFKFSLGKLVRSNHVQTSEHWKDQEIIKNKLKL